MHIEDLEKANRGAQDKNTHLVKSLKYFFYKSSNAKSSFNPFKTFKMPNIDVYLY
jgi:hypothetical protein